MASIKEVAKHAGVAISTVSKVLNNYPNVSEETKEKVKAAIVELGYVPNAVAAALSSKKSGRIAIILRLYNGTSAIDEVNMQYLYGTINTARDVGLDVVTLFYSMFEENSVEEMTNYIKTSMARHKVPKYIEFVDSFPMNAAGKILKYKMRQDAARRLGLTGDGSDTAGPGK